MLGTFVLSSDYYDSYFTKAQKIRRLIQNETNNMFKRYDLVISPTTPHTPFNIGEERTDPIICTLKIFLLFKQIYQAILQSKFQ